MNAEPIMLHDDRTKPEHPLMALDDFNFSDAWTNLDDEVRAALPDDVRRQCFERKRKLTDYIDKGRSKIERAQAIVDEAAKREPAITEWPPSLDLEVLAEHEPELPHFIIPDWLPCGYATLLAGHGGVGKSAIALDLAVCIAAGVPFFGLEVTRSRVLYLSCEDRQSILHWRLTRICAHLGIDLANLRGWLEIVDLVGADAILWDRDPRTGNTITPAYGRLERRIGEHKTEVLMIDGISDTFAGNENARAEVKRFVNSLVALIPANTGAVLLIGHVSKPGSMAGANGEGYSGSTGWHNSARARWYLYPEAGPGENGERAERTGDLILELQKSNLGRTDQSMRFSWDEQANLFLGTMVGGMTEFDRIHLQREERLGTLRALQACVDTPAATMGQRTAYHVLSARPEFPDSLRKGKPSIRRFWRHIEELRAMSYVREGNIRRSDRHYVRVLELTPEGLRACGQ